MITVTLKVLVGAVCILALSVGVSAFPWLAKYLLLEARQYSDRHYLPRKMNYFSEKLADQLSGPKVVAGEFVLAVFSAWLFYIYLDVSNPVNAAVILVTLGVMPLATLAIFLCRNGAVREFFNCPFCVWIRWAALLILIWVGHTNAASQLSDIFVGAAPHLTLAYSAGAFLSAIGILSILSAMAFDVWVVILFLVFGIFETGRGWSYYWKLRLIPAIITAAICVQMGIYQAAEGVVALSSQGKLIVADFAWEFVE